MELPVRADDGDPEDRDRRYRNTGHIATQRYRKLPP
jgi:hypothetical protein